MTGPGHHLTGLAVGVLLAGIARHLVPQAPIGVIVPAAWFGGVAPDRLEFPMWFGNRRKSLLAHRTITHWWALWAALAVWALYALLGQPGLELPAWAALGASCGAFTHILCDWPNPMGVPGWTPRQRHSLRLWRSGEHEVRMVLASAVLAALPWLTFQ